MDLELNLSHPPPACASNAILGNLNQATDHSVDLSQGDLQNEALVPENRVTYNSTPVLDANPSDVKMMFAVRP